MEVRTVLLVDDDADIRRLGELSLRAFGGLEVLLASSGAEALALLRTRRPDLVLLDVMMPGMDGPETLRQLRALAAPRDVPIVFVTAKAAPAEIERCLALGALGVVTKPFDFRGLPEQIRRLAERVPAS